MRFGRMAFVCLLAAAPRVSAFQSAPAAAGCWTFDSAYISGTQALDSCGTGLNGSIVNAAAVAGRVNEALEFSGAGSYVMVPDNPGLQLGHDLTIAAWVRSGPPTQKQNFISKYDFTLSEYGYLVQLLPSGVVNLRLGGYNVSGVRDFADTRLIADAQWHHVTVVITSSGAAFYIDGLPSSTAQFTKIQAPNWAPLYLGTYPGAYIGAPFTGALDEVRIFPQALSGAEVAALAAPGLTLNCTPAEGPKYPLIYFTQTCTASGGTPPYQFWLSGLPPGLNVTATSATGFTISGGATTTGSYSYSAYASDAASHLATRTITGSVETNPPPVITSLSPPSWTTGTPLVLTFNGTGFLPGALVVEPDAPGPVHAQPTTFISSTQISAKIFGDLTYIGPITLRFKVYNPGDMTGSNVVSYNILGVVTTITSTSPNSAVAGGPPFTLTVRGTNFFKYCENCNLEPQPGTMVYWNGTPVSNPLYYPANVVSSSELRITIPAALIASPGTVMVTVKAEPNTSYSNAVPFTILPAAPPPPAITPAAWWTFDRNDLSGYTVLDRSGNGLAGQLVYATVDGTVVAGKVNDAFQFSGVSYVAVPDSASLQLRHDLTLTGWIRATPEQTADGVARVQNVISKYDFSGAETGYILQVSPAGALNLHVGGNNLANGWRNAEDSVIIVDGAWHHFAVVIKLWQTVKFYVDGRLTSTQPQMIVPTANPSVLYLGTFPNSWSGGPFGGSLDEVRIYPVALSDADIAALFGT